MSNRDRRKHQSCIIPDSFATSKQAAAEPKIIATGSSGAHDRAPVPPTQQRPAAVRVHSRMSDSSWASDVAARSSPPPPPPQDLTSRQMRRPYNDPGVFGNMATWSEVNNTSVNPPAPAISASDLYGATAPAYQPNQYSSNGAAGNCPAPRYYNNVVPFPMGNIPANAAGMPLNDAMRTYLANDVDQANPALMSYGVRRVGARY